ncbi:alpha/beta fold hydrolase [Pseudorhodoplanes sp.]|uniref:alpha/beta fold hydrolase n=1 Tax=Pseudorhodoplanes sp. TaxID=1934341 RepID=UPI00391C38E2
MTTYVLVHGAWGGGWKFARVAEALRKRGHSVFTPTLTGAGERAHLLSGDINLTTHVADVLNVIRYEGLSDLVLLGHSYGGMVITAIADKIPEKIAALVYLDAFVPQDGQSLFDLNIPANTQMFLERAGNNGGLLIPPPPAKAYFGVNDNDAARVDALAAPQPIGTMIEKVTLTGAYRAVKKNIYVHGAVLPRESPFKRFHDAAKQAGWETHALPCGHDIMLDLPDELTEILDRAGR